MKKKTINAIITGKLIDWTRTITDESVRTLVEKNTICTGGCIASMLMGEDVNDFDFYFRNKETALAVAKYYVAEYLNNPPPKFKDQNKKLEIYAEDGGDRIKIIIKSAGIAGEASPNSYRYFESEPDLQGAEYVAAVMEGSLPPTTPPETEDKPKYRPVFLSANAITLANKVQVITRFIGEPAEIHANYDFVHVTNYWTSWDKQVVLRQEALESILAKELRYVGSKYPMCSIIRLRKFIARGWTINAGQVLKMCMNMQAFDLTKIDVLQEQLTGVDVAYFIDVIERLKEKDASRVDNAYLIEIIDRMF